MAALIGLLAGALAGHAVWGEWGAIVGGLAGFFAGATFLGKRQRDAHRKPDSAVAVAPMVVTPAPGAAMIERIAALEARVAVLERRETGAAPAEAPPGVAAAVEAAHGAVAGDAVRYGAAAGDAMPVALPAQDIAATESAVPLTAVTEPQAPSAAVSGSTASAPAPRVNPAWAWFTGGNALTRIGVVVLFFGIAFLLRYFAEHFTVPIEARLAGVAAAGGALIALGLRLAASRPGYGLSLQGAGAGILYLTTYAAFRLYAVLPDEAGMALLVAIAAGTVWLALRGDSQEFAGLAIAGGFLAPMLTTTRGAPLPLFGYVAILNGAIFALAWRRAWRALNVLGFVFTFALGLFWGERYYASEHFATVEPFLALFFAYYVAIAVLEARRGALEARRPVDGLLVFGVPVAGMVLQSALVSDYRYGAAWSAVAVAAVYAVLHAALRRRAEPALALLAQAFLALAVIFATLAVPLALDDQWTAALWAIEAAGVYWVGVRQASPAARGFALLIELCAGAAFVWSGGVTADLPLFANAYFIGAMLIALSGLATAYFADRAGSGLPAREQPLTPLVFGWGAVWWLAAGGMEIVRHLGRVEEVHATLGWIVGSVVLALVLRRALRWPRLATVGVALLPVMGIAAVADFERARTTLTVYGWLAWPAAWATLAFVLHAADARTAADDPAGEGSRGAPRLLRFVHALSVFALTAQLAWEASEWVGRFTPAHTAWVACAAALPAAACLWLVTRWRDDPRWPFPLHGDAYAVGAGTPIAALLAVWYFAVNVLSPGDVSPLPYLPLANPLDLTLALVLAAAFGWGRRFARLSVQALYGWFGVALFVALNGIVLRTAHHWGDIPWRLPALLASKPLQAALTLTWSATALAVMFTATRRGLRPLWMVGAALLAVVVGKLFLVDLGALSGLSRVVAFLGVGILLLAIGYLTPLPPAEVDGADDTRPGESR
jgi:uncharacterized membrane protein